MTKKKEAPPPNYDYTGKERVQRQRDALAAAGGARVEVMLDKGEAARLDAMVMSGVASSRRAALKYLVQQLPDPEAKECA